MAFDFKEQILILLKHKLSYQQQLKYFIIYNRLFPGHPPLTKGEMQTILNHIFPGGKNLVIDRSLTVTINNLYSKSFTIFDPIYPRLWLELPQPPLLIFYEGDLELLNRPKLSLVGSRLITSYAKQIVPHLVTMATSQEWVCVSGLARGVDKEVHQAAMNTGIKTSIAIIATGINQVYPTCHRSLQDQMAENHLLLSEYLPEMGARKHHFIMRNRLVAGISPATIVVEAAQKSGSLITANYALQFNREVYALPGRLIDPQSQGCNHLIDQGANPVFSLRQTQDSLIDLYKKQGF